MAGSAESEKAKAELDKKRSETKKTNAETKKRGEERKKRELEERKQDAKFRLEQQVAGKKKSQDAFDNLEQQKFNNGTELCDGFTADRKSTMVPVMLTAYKGARIDCQKINNAIGRYDDTIREIQRQIDAFDRQISEHVGRIGNYQREIDESTEEIKEHEATIKRLEQKIEEQKEAERKDKREEH